MEFKDVKTFDDLIQANVRFIEGKLPESPYHGGPLESDSQTLIPRLVNLHRRFRILSVDGQTGYKGSTDTVKQRPYLAFFIEKNMSTNLFLSKLKQDQDLLLVVIDRNGIVFRNTYDTERTPLTIVNSNDMWEIQTSLPANLDGIWEEATIGMEHILDNDNFYLVHVVVDKWCTRKCTEDYLLHYFVITK